MNKTGQYSTQTLVQGVDADLAENPAKGAPSITEIPIEKVARAGSKTESQAAKSTLSSSDEPGSQQDQPTEIGGPKGPEPTRYGDWEKNGRCYDF